MTVAAQKMLNKRTDTIFVIRDEYRERIHAAGGLQRE
jgi:hypothetical protein